MSAPTSEPEPRTRGEIAEQLRQDIAAGMYPVGSKLPSYRQLGTSLGAAPNTVGEAIRLLAREGRVTIRPQSGTVVNDPADRPSTPDARLHAAQAELLGMREQIRSLRDAVDQLDDELSNVIGQLRPE